LKYSRIVLYVCIFLFLLAAPVNSEQIRGELAHSLVIDEQYNPVTASVGLRELIGIDFARDEYLRGIIIEITTPDSVLQFRESFMLSIFENIAPALSPDMDRYSGSKVYSRAFPKFRRTYIDLPLGSSDSWERSSLNSIILNPSPDADGFPLLLTIDPVMKGIPSHISSSSFEMTLTPVLIEKGALKLSFSPGEASEAVEVRIDGRRVALTNGRLYLSPGIHTLDVVSDEFLPYNQSFGIEQAKTTNLDIELRPATSFIRFDAPEEAIVFFDGLEIDPDTQGTFETDPGEHVVLVRIGDYSVSKKIDVKGGKNYKVSLFFDILINDN
jgi:hypothetical protein